MTGLRHNASEASTTSASSFPHPAPHSVQTTSTSRNDDRSESLMTVPVSHSEVDLSALGSPFAEAVGDPPDKEAADSAPLLHDIHNTYGTIAPAAPLPPPAPEEDLLSLPAQLGQAPTLHGLAAQHDAEHGSAAPLGAAHLPHSDPKRPTLLSRRGVTCSSVAAGVMGVVSRGPIRVESDMILDGLADGIKCQSPVGLKATVQQNADGDAFRVKTLRNYVTGPVIGEGAFGKVRLAIDNNAVDVASAKVAIKKVRRQKLRKVRGGEEMLAREAEIQELLTGGLNTMPLLCHFSDETNGKVYFVFPFAMGSLQTLIDHCLEGETQVSTESATKLAFELLNGIAHMHSRCVVHKDIKPPNCMLMPDMTLMISDFGTAEILPEDGMTKGGNATPAYQSPEVARGAVQFCGYAADMWSAGVTIFQALALDIPFHGSNPWKTYEAIVDNAIDFGAADRGWPPLTDLLHRLLEKDPTHRGVASDLLDHKVFVSIPHEEASAPAPPAAAASPHEPVVPATPVDPSSPYSPGEGGASRRQAKLAGVRIDWRSGRGAGSTGFQHRAKRGYDAVRQMQDDTLELHRAMCAAMYVALDSSLLPKDPMLVAFMEDCDYAIPASPPDTSPESPLMTPTASFSHANVSFFPHGGARCAGLGPGGVGLGGGGGAVGGLGATPDDHNTYLGSSQGNDDALISPHTLSPESAPSEPPYRVLGHSGGDADFSCQGAGGSTPGSHREGRKKRRQGAGSDTSSLAKEEDVQRCCCCIS